jgi:hypothetical protein
MVLGEIAEASVDRAILSCAWVQERRQRRRLTLAGCSLCGEPVTVDNGACTATFLPAGEAVAEDTVMLN